MARTTALLLLVAALCAASACAATWMPGFGTTDMDNMMVGEGMGIGDSFQDMATFQAMMWGRHGGKHGDINKRRKKDESVASVVFRYYVPPSKHQDFVDEWHKLEDGTRKEKKNRMVDLQKTMNDNIMFFGYGEWEDEESFKDHLEQGYTRDFFDFLLDQDIPLTWQPLFKFTDDVNHWKTEDSTSKDRVYMMVGYTVPPHHFDDFVKIWEEVADDVEKEKGVKIYSLRKMATNNLDWFIYGIWDSWDDYMDHFKSKHIKKLLRWNEKHDVMWCRSPLIKMGKDVQPS